MRSDTRDETLKRLAIKSPLRAPSPALVISLIALFVALGGGTALAGGLSGLISGKKIINRSIAEDKLTAGAIKALRGHAYDASGGPVTPFADTGWTTVGKSLTLPAGFYVVMAKTHLYMPSGGGCYLDYVGGKHPLDYAAYAARGPDSGESAPSLVGTLKTTGTTVTLHCRSDQGDASAGGSDIVAIKVGIGGTK